MRINFEIYRGHQDMLRRTILCDAVPAVGDCVLLVDGEIALAVARTQTDHFVTKDNATAIRFVLLNGEHLTDDQRQALLDDGWLKLVPSEGYHGES